MTHADQDSRITIDSHDEAIDDMPDPDRDEIQQWRDELEKLRANVAEKNERIALLQQVLDMVPIMDRLRGVSTNTSKVEIRTHEPTIVNADVTLVSAIPMVLQKHRRPMTPSEIKRHLPDAGYTKPIGETYFYTALRRSIEKKRVAKNKDGNYIFVETS
jgi:hypothetical protein